MFWRKNGKDALILPVRGNKSRTSKHHLVASNTCSIAFGISGCNSSSTWFGWDYPGCGVGTINCSDGTTEGSGPITLAFGLTVNKSAGNPVNGIWAAVIPGAAGPSGARGTKYPFL